MTSDTQPQPGTLQVAIRLPGQEVFTVLGFVILPDVVSVPAVLADLALALPDLITLLQEEETPS